MKCETSDWSCVYHACMSNDCQIRFMANTKYYGKPKCAKMTKLEHLAACKAYLRKVVAHRRFLNKNGHGKPISKAMIDTMREIDYWVPAIVSFDSMWKWMCNHDFKARVMDLIPTTKKIWEYEYDDLVKEGYEIRFREEKEVTV